MVEDEKDLGEPLALGLREEGFQVEWKATGRDAMRTLDSETFDLVILDLMLPDINGEAILNYLKQRVDCPPVLMLTARTLLADKLAMFRKGCDDYLTKPVIFEELLERVRALLRRTQRSPQASRYQYRDLTLDQETFRLSAGEESVTLTPKEAAICRLLMNEPEKVVSRREILQGVWGLKEEPLSNLVGIHVFKLRKKFAAVGREDWFQTVRSSGFLLCEPGRGHGS